MRIILVGSLENSALALSWYFLKNTFAYIFIYDIFFFIRVVRVHVCKRSLLRVWLHHLLGWLTDLVTERSLPHLLTVRLRVWLVYSDAGSVGLPAKQGAEWKRSARLSRGCALIKFGAVVWTILIPRWHLFTRPSPRLQTDTQSSWRNIFVGEKEAAEGERQG